MGSVSHTMSLVYHYGKKHFAQGEYYVSVSWF